MALDTDKLNAFLGRAIGDLGAAISSALMILGDRLGYYKALAERPRNAAELAKETKTAERYAREWLDNQAAGGIVEYDPATGRYTLPPEHAFCLASEESPVFVPGAYEVVKATLHGVERMERNFRTGEGMSWGEQHPCLFSGTERFFRANYIGNLLSSWIPALEGVERKLLAGARVADVGCGHGASTVLLAKAFPKSQFTGFDYHAPSIEAARERASRAGLGNAHFEVALSTAYPGEGYDLIAFFDCLHDMADPEGAARHVRRSLAPDGTWMVVEPFAGDRPEENHTPVGRVFYGASAMICVPTSLSGKGPALGAQAGEARLRKVVEAGGFRRFRRATQTPFNLVLEARP